MMEDINKIPDPEFEKTGFRGWHCFKRAFEDIKQDYDLYGDIVLEKRLGKSIEIYKAAFTSENFFKAIRDIWEKRYHYVIAGLDELITWYERAKENKICWEDLLPESNSSLKAGETKGMDQVFALSAVLYNCILKNANDDRLVLLHGKKVYELTVKEKVERESYRRIRVKKIDVIEVEES